MWIVAGLSMGLVFVTLAFWFRSRKAELTWYEWLLGLLGVALFFFTMQNFFASIAELEPTAPGMFLVIFGIPALVLLAVALLLPWWRYFRLTRRNKQPGGPAT